MSSNDPETHDADQWYCRIMGSEMGPMPFERLQELAEQSSLLPSDQVRQHPSTEWINSGSIDGLFPPSPERDIEPHEPTHSESTPDYSDLLASAPDADICGDTESPEPSHDDSIEALIAAELAVPDRDRPSPPVPAAINEPAQAQLASEPAELLPLPEMPRRTIHSRVLRRLPDWSAGTWMRVGGVVAVLLTILLVFSGQRRANHRVAFDELEQLHRHIQQAQTAGYDASHWADFRDHCVRKQMQIRSDILEAGTGSAGSDLLTAADAIPQLIDELNPAESNPSSDTRSRAVFHEAMRNARRRLYD